MTTHKKKNKKKKNTSQIHLSWNRDVQIFLPSNKTRKKVVQCTKTNQTQQLTLKWCKCVTIKTVHLHRHTHTLSQPAMRDNFKGNWFYPRLISPSLSLELHQQSVNRLAGQAPFVSAKETPQSDHHHSHTHTQHPCRNPATEFKHSETQKCCHTHNHNIIQMHVHTQSWRVHQCLQLITGWLVCVKRAAVKMGSHVTVSLQVWMTDTKLEQLHTDLQKLNNASEICTENAAYTQN